MRCPESQGNSVASACSGIESRGGWRGSTHSTMFAADGFKLSVSVPVEEGTVRGSAQLSGGEARSCGAPPLPAPEPVDVNWQPPIGARAAQTRARPAVDRLLALTLSTDNRGPWAGSRVGVHLHPAIVFWGLCSDSAIPASHRPQHQTAHTGRFAEAPEDLPPFLGGFPTPSSPPGP